MTSSKLNLETFIKNQVKTNFKNSEVETILNKFKFLELKKNNTLVRKGDVCTHFCYIDSGILQHSTTVLEEEKTTYLALKNSFTCALNSFKNEIPARKNIKALIDCNLYVLNLQDFNTLLKTNSCFNRFYFSLIEDQIFKIDDHRIDLLTLTPEERYTKLLVSDTELVQKVPLHYLASYLGISSRHVSRIRKNIK